MTNPTKPSKERVKKQHTQWIWWSQGQNPKDYLKVGIVYNKSKGVPLDMIAVRFSSSKKGHGVEFNCRVDEAINLIAGFSKVLLFSSWSIGKSEVLLKKYVKEFL